MTIFLNLLLVIFSCVLIAKGADWLVDSAAKLANRLGVTELVIGLTVVAMGTSAPEFAVTIGAALRGAEDISVANVVGSNIFNLGFILGGQRGVAGRPHPRPQVPRGAGATGCCAGR